MDEFLFQLGNLMLFFFFISVITVPLLMFITGRYMDKQLSHIKSNIANMFALFPKSLANAFIYSGGILLNGWSGRKSVLKKTYGDLNMRDYARPIDKFLSFTFYGSWLLAAIIAVILFILEWYQHGFPSHLFGF